MKSEPNFKSMIPPCKTQPEPVLVIGGSEGQWGQGRSVLFCLRLWVRGAHPSQNDLMGKPNEILTVALSFYNRSTWFPLGRKIKATGFFSFARGDGEADLWHHVWLFQTCRSILCRFFFITDNVSHKESKKKMLPYPLLLNRHSLVMVCWLHHRRWHINSGYSAKEKILPST